MPGLFGSGQTAQPQQPRTPFFGPGFKDAMIKAAPLFSSMAAGYSSGRGPYAYLDQGIAGVQAALKAKRDEEAAAAASAAFGGLVPGGMGPQGGMGGGNAPSGTWTPAKPEPKLTEKMQGTMQGGMSYPGMPKAGLGGGAALSFGSATMTPQEMLIEGAKARGLNPIDVATAISYETGGKFDPMISGPTTQWGTHRGLIQFGEPQAQQYGVDFSDPQSAMRSQLDPTSGAVWQYLEGSGVKPGMGLDEIYSAINAGSVGRMGASDAGNGGAPGTVADKVASMGPHREKAAAFLGGTWSPATSGTPAVTDPMSDPYVKKMMEVMAMPGLTPEQRGVVEMQLQGRIASLAPAPAATPVELKTFTGPDGSVYSFNPVTGESKPMTGAETPKAGYRFLTPEEIAANPKLDPSKAWQIGPDNRVVEAGGGGDTINLGADDFATTSGKKAAERFDGYIQDGWRAQQMTGDLQTLATLAPLISTGVEGQVVQGLGPIAEAVGIDINGLGEGQAFKSIVDRMAPLMRAPGSGASSDFDARQFLNSLPKIGNTAEGNAIIVETLSAIQSAKMKAAEIAAQAQSGEMTWQQAEKLIREMPDPYAKFKAFSDGVTGIAPPAATVIDGYSIEAMP